jgi:hypothetical protein
MPCAQTSADFNERSWKNTFAKPVDTLVDNSKARFWRNFYFSAPVIVNYFCIREKGGIVLILGCACIWKKG